MERALQRLLPLGAVVGGEGLAGAVVGRRDRVARLGSHVVHAQHTRHAMLRPQQLMTNNIKGIVDVFIIRGILESLRL